MTTDPLALAQALIRCPSVTPADGGAQDVLAAALAELGFAVTRLRFGAIENLFARIGSAGPHFCFAGHTDVVPAGGGAWQDAPFAGTVRDGVLHGRGACDMKGAVAAFVAACAQHLAAAPLRGSISLLVTGDEEGEAVDGTARVLEWMQAQGQIPDFCLVGEPTNPARLGEVIKIGRRGSLTARITVHGTQGHVAYPHRTDNPVHRLVRVLAALTALPLDAGSEWFEPSGVQITTVDVGNRTANLVPARAEAVLNIRFNDRHSGASLAAWLRACVAGYAERAEVTTSLSGESFLTTPGPQVETLRRAIADATGIVPRLDTGGGTSDARFIARYCPVAEFGLVGATMHQVDERVPVAELRALAGAYRAVLAAFGVWVPAAAAGVARLARFRADGLAAFDASPVGLLNALAPWLAFALVGFGLELAGGTPRSAAVELLGSLVALLAPPVLSQGMAQVLGRASALLRYAVAATWCQWLMPPALLAAVLGSGVLIAVGVPQQAAEALAGLTALGYAVALHVFLAWRGLAVSLWRAGVVVAAVNLGTATLTFGPLLLAGILGAGR